tara:strand:- start:5211 stop:5471 length:261 start_codon:yes stop_codon:yes gene_type:complete
MICPETPSNVCTIVDLESLLKSNNTYIQCFTAPISVWVITHSLSKFPSVTVVDVDNKVVVGEVDYTDNNIITITFSIPFSGCAFLN